MNNIYALSDKLTPLQTQSFLACAIAFGIFGYLLLEHRMLGNGLTWFVNLFTRERRAHMQPQSHT